MLDHPLSVKSNTLVRPPAGINVIGIEADSDGDLMLYSKNIVPNIVSRVTNPFILHKRVVCPVVESSILQLPFETLIHYLEGFALSSVTRESPVDLDEDAVTDGIGMTLNDTPFTEYVAASPPPSPSHSLFGRYKYNSSPYTR